MKDNTKCETCANCIPIGEGDHICLEIGDGTPVMVIEEYSPADEYLACNGNQYERN